MTHACKPKPNGHEQPFEIDTQPRSFVVAILLFASALAAGSPSFAQQGTSALTSDPNAVSLAKQSQLGTDGFCNSNGVRLHYVTAGQGPLVVMIHGFPDFWYSWRFQMPALSQHFKVVAIDQRGFNRSDQPDAVDDYHLDLLVGDVLAVIKHFGRDKAILVGHDWGGAVAWSTAISHPKVIDQLVILNLPHIKGLLRELKHNPDQQAASAYARAFQIPGAEQTLSPQLLANLVGDPAAQPHYVAAMKRSSKKGMLNYYRANYPRPPYEVPPLPNVKCSVLMIHGLKDPALLPPALNNTWQWVDNDLTLVTVPNAGHFVQHDAAEFVTKTMLSWLRRKVSRSNQDATR